VLLGVLLIVVCVHAGDVVEMNTALFNQHVGKDPNSPWFVDFFAPWCAHCITLKPVYDELATRLKGRCNVARVDCTEERELCWEHKIMGYPTLKFYFEDRVVVYRANRDLDSLYSFLDDRIKLHSGPLTPTLLKAEGTSSQPGHDDSDLLPPTTEGPDDDLERAKEDAEQTGLSVIPKWSARNVLTSMTEPKTIVLLSEEHRGVAEPIRLFLHDLGFEFTDTRLTTQRWEEIVRLDQQTGDDPPQFPFLQLPILRDPNVELPIAGVGPILRYLTNRPPVSCVGWRQTGNCDPNGPREFLLDRSCTAIVPNGASGYCECGEAEIRARVNCSHESFICADQCPKKNTRIEPNGIGVD
jgi:thiol-disulfide isomerase/thioredoxin